MKTVGFALVALMIMSPLVKAQASEVTTQEDTTWSVFAEYDTVTAKRSQAARVVNADGYRLAVLRVEDQTAWLFLFAPIDSDIVFSDSLFPVIRIDQEDPHDFGDMFRHLRQFGWNHWVSRGPMTAVHIWHGKPAPEGISLLIEEMRGGKRLVLRYWTAEGNSSDIGFSLVGAREAIGRALDLP